MRNHFSLATVLATLALFVSLSGTAAAAVIISSNHQVAAHTIAGANAPRGDNRNLIAGTVGTTDLHGNAVTGAQVKNGSLTGADLANGSIGTSKLKLPKISWNGTDSDPVDGAPHHTVLSLDGVTIGASCTFATAITRLSIYIKSPGGGALRGSYTAGPLGSPTPALSDTTVTATPLDFADTGGTGAVLLSGQFNYRSSTRVITLLLDGSAIEPVHVCDLHGTAIPAPN